METPAELSYSTNHEWVRAAGGGSVIIGITDFAQQSLGDVLFINLCGAGEKFVKGEPIGDVESIKSVSEIICPVSGTVAKINEKVLENPGLINSDPYGAWLAEIASVTDLNGLISAGEYEAFIAVQ